MAESRDPFRTSLSDRGAARRHQWLTAPSGFTLCVCLFLPLMQVCNRGDALLPLMVPPFWWPHVIGAVVAFAALARNDLRGYATLLRGVLYGTVIGWGVLSGSEMVEAGSFGVGLALIAGAGFVITLIALRAPDEYVLARCSMLGAAGSIVWFALFVAEPSSLVGAYVGLVSSCALFAGATWWRIELALESRRSRWSS